MTTIIMISAIESILIENLLLVSDITVYKKNESLNWGSIDTLCAELRLSFFLTSHQKTNAHSKNSAIYGLLSLFILGGLGRYS